MPRPWHYTNLPELPPHSAGCYATTPYKVDSSTGKSLIKVGSSRDLHGRIYRANLEYPRGSHVVALAVVTQGRGQGRVKEPSMVVERWLHQKLKDVMWNAAGVRARTTEWFSTKPRRIHELFDSLPQEFDGQKHGPIKVTQILLFKVARQRNCERCYS